MSSDRARAPRWPALLLAAAGVAALAAPPSRPTTGKPTMNEAQTQALELLKLPDAAWFGLDGAARAALQTRLAAAIAPSPALPNAAAQPALPVLAVGAPARVAPTQIERVPFLVAAQFDARREWEVNYKPNRVVVVSDLATGRVQVGSASPHDKRRPPPPSRSGAPPSPKEAGDAMTSVELLNLADLMGTLHGPTRLALTVLYLDWKSNTVMIDVAGSGGGNAKPPAAPEPRSVGVARQLTDPRSSFKPGAPAGVVFSLAGPRLLRGMVNLPLAEAGLLPGADAGHAGLLPVTVLLVQRDEPSPLQFDTAAGASVATAAGGAPMAQAVFELDLNHLAREHIAAGDYQVYLVVGAQVAGPKALHVGP